VPVIVHLLATTPNDVGRAADRLSSVEGVAGLELGFASDTPPDDVCALVDAAKFEGAHPLIAKVPAGRVGDLASALVEGGVDALTLTAPPRAVLPLYRGDDPLPTRYLRGRLYGPSRFPRLLNVLARWASELPVPIIACGGIADARDALACLSLGAEAVQIEACVWRDPTILTTIAAALALPVVPEEDVAG
jgi:dihydroorotate dehydrogenase (NAD+) catalytic subunit